MRSFVITVFIVCIALTSCKKNGNESREGSLSINLHDCANDIFQDNAVNLCFDSIISDSRCPANAICIWEGAATCKFLFSKNNEVHPLTLSTITWPGGIKDTTLLGYKIEFINLTPYPGAPPAPGEEVKAEVKITEL